MPTYAENKKSAEKYLAKMDEIKIRVPKGSGLKEAIQAHAQERGESVQGFILRAIVQTMQRDTECATLDGDQPTLME
jgi:predicted DNA binding CopG/RHH family protein